MNSHTRHSSPPIAGKLARAFEQASTRARSGLLFLLIPLLVLVAGSSLGAQSSPATDSISQTLATNIEPRFNVESYVVEAGVPLPASVLQSLFTKYRGTNVDLNGIIDAADAVQTAYEAQGKPGMSVAINSEEIRDGVVTMRVFQGATNQIVVSGRRYYSSRERAAVADRAKAEAHADFIRTNKNISIKAYVIEGDTLLTTKTLTSILEKYTGTNMSLADIEKAKADLQSEYVDRGYPTVQVTLPTQQITNQMVRMRVFEGRLSSIDVTGNRYYSSNNVMRALPSLHTNAILLNPVFQAELNRANANQDRQIRPEIAPGPDENTSQLLLKVQDRLPLHAKTELNNQNSPGTPQLRVNSSAVYNNLWQLDHSLGLQYSFSPEQYKDGERWAFYDKPLVVNYSGFYRLPLGEPGPVDQQIAARPGAFGYSEATRRFNLPPPSGQAELNFYASRSAIDTGVETLDSSVIYDVPGVRQVFRTDVQQDWTINNDVGFRLTKPLPQVDGLRSTLSAGPDYKTYEEDSFKTNLFTFTEITIGPKGEPNPPIISTVASPVPATHHSVDYFPLSVRYDGSVSDPFGTTSFGLGVTGNPWYSGSHKNMESAVGSTEASGNWVTLTPSLTRDLTFQKDWTLSVHAEGQWSSEPLLSTEQFGAGGVSNVRGYHEGEEFGDTGWRVNLEQKTPPHVVGSVFRSVKMTIRGSVYMDYAQTYLLDPEGRPGSQSLWGTGIGGVLSIGAYWEVRLLSSWPLLTTTSTEAYQPHFNFSLTAQF